MKTKLHTLLACLAAGLLASGCASISHTRDVLANGKVVARETEKATGFLTKAAIEGLRITTKDGTYAHTFAAKKASETGDVDMARTLIESTGTAVGNGIGAAAKAAVK